MPPDQVVARKALESRADVDSLETLQEERREIITRWAPLAAKFKGGSVASVDSIRKQHRALIATEYATKAANDPKPPSEVSLERLANADPRHVKFCDDLREQYVEYVTLDNEITEINERVQSREVELRAYTREIGLQ